MQITCNITTVTGNILKSRTKIHNIAGSVFANIHEPYDFMNDFKHLAGIFHIPNTKTLGKSEF